MRVTPLAGVTLKMLHQLALKRLTAVLCDDSNPLEVEEVIEWTERDAPRERDEFAMLPVGSDDDPLSLLEMLAFKRVEVVRKDIIEGPKHLLDGRVLTVYRVQIEHRLGAAPHFEPSSFISASLTVSCTQKKVPLPVATLA